MSEHLTTKEVAALLGKTTRTLVEWRRKGIGPAYAVIGHKVVYLHESLVEWMTEQVVTPPCLPMARQRALADEVRGTAPTPSNSWWLPVDANATEQPHVE